jgi:hypothetical protein
MLPRVLPLMLRLGLPRMLRLMQMRHLMQIRGRGLNLQLMEWEMLLGFWQMI